MIVLWTYYDRQCLLFFYDNVNQVYSARIGFLDFYQRFIFSLLLKKNHYNFWKTMQAKNMSQQKLKKKIFNHFKYHENRFLCNEQKLIPKFYINWRTSLIIIIIFFLSN